MEQLKQMLEAYRNGERGLPTYDELAAIAYAPQYKLMDWMPIQTAPKDGQEILLYLPKPFDRITVARWFDLWENWIEGEFPDPQGEYCGIGSGVPIFWRPISESPANNVA